MQERDLLSLVEPVPATVEMATAVASDMTRRLRLMPWLGCNGAGNE
jgi:hypothetical protein